MTSRARVPKNRGAGEATRRGQAGGPSTLDRRSFAVSSIVLGISSGFYAWVASGPAPANTSGLKAAPHGLFDGLPGALALAVAVSFLLVGALSASPAARPARERLAVASAWLYLAGLASAAGAGALVLAPVLFVAALVVPILLENEARADGLLLTLHAGYFATAVLFFHQWAQYRSGWDPFVKNLGALGQLWF